MTRGRSKGGASRRVAGVATTGLLLATVMSGLGATPAAGVDRTQAIFTNPVAITIPSGALQLVCPDFDPVLLSSSCGPGSPYPSGIAVGGLTGTITDVNVTINNLSHTLGTDIDIVLAGPTGQKVLIMTDCGGVASNDTITFDQAAGGTPNCAAALVSGSFQPINNGNFDGSGLPAGPTSTTLNAFNGTAPNGSWSLFVYDDAHLDTGSMAGGWTLEIITNTPTCTGFNPTSGAPGSPVVITGTNFTGATNVTFNGVQASVNVVNSTTINTTVPQGATTGPVAVTTPAGTATCPGNFTVIPAPVITSFTPGNGKVGTAVTINGTTFTGATSLTFNGVAAVIGTNSGTQITTTVPAGASTGPIAVTTASGTGTSAVNFVVKHARSLTFSVDSPATGNVSVLDGFNACRSSVPVKLQHFRNGQWRNVGTDQTNGNGKFNFGPQNTEGKYRALAPKYTTPSGDVCLKKTSPVDRV